MAAFLVLEDDSQKKLRGLDTSSVEALRDSLVKEALLSSSSAASAQLLKQSREARLQFKDGDEWVNLEDGADLADFGQQKDKKLRVKAVPFAASALTWLPDTYAPLAEYFHGVSEAFVKCQDRATFMASVRPEHRFLANQFYEQQVRAHKAFSRTDLGDDGEVSLCVAPAHVPRQDVSDAFDAVVLGLHGNGTKLDLHHGRVLPDSLRSIANGTLVVSEACTQIEDDPATFARVEEVNLSYNQLGSADVTPVCKLCRALPSLRFVDLSNNRLTANTSVNETVTELMQLVSGRSAGDVYVAVHSSPFASIDSAEFLCSLDLQQATMLVWVRESFLRATTWRDMLVRHESSKDNPRKDLDKLLETMAATHRKFYQTHSSDGSMLSWQQHPQSDMLEGTVYSWKDKYGFVQPKGSLSTFFAPPPDKRFGDWTPAKGELVRFALRPNDEARDPRLHAVALCPIVRDGET